MPGEKRFRTSFMGGFKKADVNLYIEKILREFDDKLKEKDDEIASLKNQSKELRLKYEELSKKAEQITEDRTKIADVLIKAQKQAESMLEDARIEALEEKKKLEEVIEQEKEKLVDIRQEMKSLKNEVVNTLKKYESQLGTFVPEEEEQTG
jgi:cell division initiation protein